MASIIDEQKRQHPCHQRQQYEIYLNYMYDNVLIVKDESMEVSKKIISNNFDINSISCIFMAYRLS